MSHDPRNPDQLRRHYEVEKALADRLRRSTRAERATLFRTLYDELFARVPDHPRLTRRETPESCRRAVEARMALLRGHLAGVKTFLEFAPGDCRLAFEVCRHVEQVLAVDISDQSGSPSARPSNFTLVVYDGWHLDLPAGSVDLAFSYQFLEHLHPDDFAPHFQTVHRLLKPGGAYIFSTPHRYAGPHDISRHFSDIAQGFHLKEWTYGETFGVLKAVGFSAAHPYRLGRLRPGALWKAATLAIESVMGALPRPLRRALSTCLLQDIILLVRK